MFPPNRPLEDLVKQIRSEKESASNNNNNNIKDEKVRKELTKVLDIFLTHHVPWIESNKDWQNHTHAIIYRYKTPLIIGGSKPKNFNPWDGSGYTGLGMTKLVAADKVTQSLYRCDP